MTFYPKAVIKRLLDHSWPGTLAEKTGLSLHITQGSTAQGAWDWWHQSVSPDRVSAHAIVDRDPAATVYQTLPFEEVGFHVAEANRHWIGIEHVAIAGNPRYAITDAQYTSSAELVAWLCSTLNIPCDRDHIKGHYEVSKTGGHVGCCEPTLSVDRVVAMAKALMETPA